MEGKNKPTKGPYAESNFEHSFGSKIATLVVIIKYHLWGYGRYLIMDSDFIYVTSLHHNFHQE